MRTDVLLFDRASLFDLFDIFPPRVYEAVSALASNKAQFYFINYYVNKIL